MIIKKGRSRVLNKYLVEKNITKIYATNGKEILIDTEDLEKIKGYTWRINKGGYASTEFRESPNKTKRLLLHRVINDTPINMITDHKNGNKLDNRKCNLRTCNHSENALNINTRKDCSSGFTGVDYIKRDKKWRARIRKNGKTIYNQYFNTRELAIEAREKAMKIYLGEFNPLISRLIEEGE